VLYNFSIRLLQGLYAAASIVNPKAKLFVSGRRDWHQKLTAFARTIKNPVWVHCASLGEFEQGRPVMEALKAAFPSRPILLTFFSPSGYEVRKNYAGADGVFYLPMDTPSNARKFVETVNPVLAIFVKYEFWYNYSRELRKRNIPLLSISCIFRKDQVFFKWYGSTFRRILAQFSYFFVQNPESIELLKSLGLTNAAIAGDTRFDRVFQVTNSAEDIPIARQFKGGDKVFVIGSCWPEDLEILIPFINENQFQLKFIIAPHEVTMEFLSEIEKSLQVKTVRFSAAADNHDAQVLLIDNIGMLSRLYRYGEFSYVGGAFGKGLHNILEAACYGVPVFFGNKNYDKFQEAVDLIMRGGAFEVGSYTDLKTKYEMLHNRPENFLLACEVTRQYVLENLGATKKIVDYCRQCLPL
jgi:3-deoxy-D-manno-octulosonic-acid transferase